MSTNHTPNYNLSQWVRTDKIQMEDFNTDNAKIDAALKAGSDSRAALHAGLEGKAEKSALDAEVQARSSADSSIRSTLARKGNCQIYYGSYTGTGTFGQDNPSSYTFPGKPFLVAVLADTRMFLAVQGSPSGYTLYNDTNSPGHPTTSWSGNTIQWYSYVDRFQFNESGRRYTIVALYEP